MNRYIHFDVQDADWTSICSDPVKYSGRIARRRARRERQRDRFARKLLIGAVVLLVAVVVVAAVAQMM